MSDYQPILFDLNAIADELAEVGDDDLLAIKAGRRHSADDESLLQDIYDGAQNIADLAVSLGATPDDEEIETEEEEELDEGMEEVDAPDAVKMAYSDPMSYAQHECGDIMAASAALQTLAQLAASELSEDHAEEGTLPKVTQAMRVVLEYIEKEIDAIESSDTYEGKAVMVEGNDTLGGATVPPDAKAQRTFGGKKREDLDDTDFAGPDRSFPIATAQDVKDAARLIGKAENPEAVKRKIIAIAKRKGFADAIPDAWKEETKGVEFIGDDLAVCPGYDVKAISDGEGWSGGYLIRFGGDGDLSHWRDIFTSETDYGHAKSSDVWVHHRLLPGLGKRRLANPAEIGVDDVGVFIKHLLDMRDPYERSLYGLVQQGKLGWSSGAPSHLVERKAIDGGRHEIVCWPLGTDSSYTPCPAGGFSVDAKAVKSLFDDVGLDLLEAMYDDQVDDTAKAIELELLAIEAEYATLAGVF